MNDTTKPAPSAAHTRKVAYAVVLVAIGVALAPYTSFPIGIAKVNPTQHCINVIGAVALGVGTLLAFPGGMIGALLAGCMFAWRKHISLAAAGEIAGTGLIAPVVSALWVAPVFMGKAIPYLALVPSFMASTVAGALLGVLALKFLQRADIVDIAG